MTDGSGERGGERGRKSSSRGRPSAPFSASGTQGTSAGRGRQMKPAGPPKFMNRVPSRSLARSSGRQDYIPHYIPLTRARPLNGVFVQVGVQVSGGAIVRGGRPFAPRVSIERGDLPGTRRIDLRFDFEARFARAASLAFALPTPKRPTRLNNEGTRFSGV